MPTYDPQIPADLIAITEQVMADHHPDLIEAEATVGHLYARSTRPGQAAVKLHGYPCHATIKVNSLKDRAEGKPDATITVDGDSWPDLDYEQKVALIDHELYHLTVKRDKKGRVDRDDRGRPKLKCRLHDYQIGGFAEIAERHGEASFEVKYARSLRENFGEQLLMDWADDRDARQSRGRRRIAEAVAGSVSTGATA